MAVLVRASVRNARCQQVAGKTISGSATSTVECRPHLSGASRAAVALHSRIDEFKLQGEKPAETRNIGGRKEERGPSLSCHQRCGRACLRRARSIAREYEARSPPASP